MVERIHVGVEKAILLRPAVPSFPNRGRAMENRIQPRRIVLTEQQPVSDIRMSARRERGIEMTNANETGAQMPIERLDIFHQVFGGSYTQGRGKQVHRQGE